jgi:hypothetical protein
VFSPFLGSSVIGSCPLLVESSFFPQAKQNSIINKKERGKDGFMAIILYSIYVKYPI